MRGARRVAPIVQAPGLHAPTSTTRQIPPQIKMQRVLVALMLGAAAAFQRAPIVRPPASAYNEPQPQPSPSSFGAPLPRAASATGLRCIPTASLELRRVHLTVNCSFWGILKVHTESTRHPRVDGQSEDALSPQNSAETGFFTHVKGSRGGIRDREEEI